MKLSWIRPQKTIKLSFTNPENYNKPEESFEKIDEFFESVGEERESPSIKKDEPSEGKPTKPVRRAPSGLRRLPGRRPMKEYPLTEIELWSMSGLGIFATIFFSFATFLLGLYVSSKESVDLAIGVKSEILAHWNTTSNLCLIGAIFMIFLMLLDLIIFGLAVSKIISGTHHD